MDESDRKDLSFRFRIESAAQIVRNRGLSGVGRILDNKEIACGDGLTGTGNSLVKSPRSRKKSGEARQQTAS